MKKVNDDSEVIIIGAGAAGLLAAREISKMKSVTILEARNRLGGRIFTTTPEGFSIPIEAGAEFIHGELPITMSILKEANIPFYEIEGETYQVKNGEVIKSGDVIEGISVLSSKVKQLKEDIPFSEFLKKYLNEEKYAEVKESAVRFVEGYDAADINKASTFALSKEWGSEGVSSPYRIEGGYQRIIDFLYKEAAKHGCKIVTSSMVKQINWKKNNAEVLTQSGDRYEAKKILVTVPAGILKSSEGNNAFIKFNPGLKEISGALNSIGYGPVIKVFFEFKEAFWDPEEADAGKLHRPGFIISDTIFTAWWSQLPKEVPLLTGWFAGPNVDKMHNMSSNHLIEEAVSALCKIFDVEKSFIEKKIKSAFIASWKEDPFSLGAYSYATVETPEAKKVLNKPIDDTIFFAGEALSEDESIGTVEAAFASGLSAAVKIMENGKCKM